VDADALITDYIGRLRAATWPLPAARREELQAEVAAHIEAALAEAGARDESAVRNVLDRLGEPEDIAAAEGALPASLVPSAGPPVVAQGGAPSFGAVEILAILFLTVGSVILPFIGTIAGLAFTWASRVWGTGTKVIATVIVVGLLALPILAVLAARYAY
jgi:hypothetical protein